MDKLVDMKMNKETAETIARPQEAEGPQYPWGLTLTLDEASIEKLGIDFDSIRIDKEITIHAIGKIISMSESQYPKKTSQSISIQITKMAIEKGKFDKYHEKKKEGPG